MQLALKTRNSLDFCKSFLDFVFLKYILAEHRASNARKIFYHFSILLGIKKDWSSCWICAIKYSHECCEQCR